MVRPGEIQAIAGRTGVRDTQIEKDYVISWVLYGISKNNFLKENLIFKGGTVLKKAYFPNYRFSDDLSFTFKGDLDVPAIKAAFAEVIKWVYETSGITLALKGEVQNAAGNFNFYISYTGPLGGRGAEKDIKVDISKDELLHNEPEEKEVVNSYSDLTDEYCSVLCYTLDEIVGEKMRSLMQRTMPRDLYDLWYLFEMDGYDIQDCIFTFQAKTKFKSLDTGKFVRVIQEKESKFAKQWKDHLSHQMTALPEFRKVWRELEKSWRTLERFLEKQA